MPAGRPTKYTPEICDRMLEFFSIDTHIDVPEVTEGKNFSKTTIKHEPNPLPTFEKFAVLNDIHVDTMIEWTKVYPEFSEAYRKCKLLQKNFLIQNGLSGLYNAAAFCFVAKNCTDMRDKTEVEHSGLPVPPSVLEVKIKE